MNLEANRSREKLKSPRGEEIQKDTEIGSWAQKRPAFSDGGDKRGNSAGMSNLLPGFEYGEDLL